MKKFLAMIIFVVFTTNSQAGNVNLTGLYDSGDPVVIVSFDGGIESTVAGPQTDGVKAFYCTQLSYSNFLPASYPVTPSNLLANGDAKESNEVGWLLTQTGNTSEGRSAVQLAVWEVTENNFSYIGGSQSLRDNYNSLVTQLPNVVGDYPAHFLLAQHDGNLYQDLVFKCNSVPEPSSIVLSGFGIFLIAACKYFKRWAS